MMTVAIGFSMVLAVGLLLLLAAPHPALPRAEAAESPGFSAVTWQGRLDGLFHEAGLSHLRPGSAAGLWVVGALLVGVTIWLVFPLPLLGVLAGVWCLQMGPALLRARRERRARTLRHQWPGMVDHLRSAVRSGAGVADAVWALHDVAPPALREGLAHFRTSLEAGASVDSSLVQLKHEWANPVSDRIIEALRMAHEVGGRELPGVLQSLQESVRSDIAVREDALAKQSWIRAASQLGAAAPWVVLLLIAGRPETQAAYNSATGAVLLVVGAVVSALAYRVMKKLGTLPTESRWFQ